MGSNYEQNILQIRQMIIDLCDKTLAEGGVFEISDIDDIEEKIRMLND